MNEKITNALLGFIAVLVGVLLWYMVCGLMEERKANEQIQEYHRQLGISR